MRILLFTSLIVLCFSCKKDKTAVIQQPTFQYNDIISSTLRATTVNSSKKLFHFGYSTDGLSGKLMIYDLAGNSGFETSYDINSSSLSNQCAASIGDQSFVLTNAQYNFNTKQDPLLAIFNSQGLMTKSIVFSDPMSEVVQDIIATKDNNLLLFSIDGDNPTNAILRKCTTNGDLIWTKYFTTMYNFYSSRIVELNSGKFAFWAGEINNTAAFLIIVDPANNTTDVKPFTFSVRTNQMRSMCINKEGMITLVSGINQNFWVASVDPENGTILWENVLGVTNVGNNANGIAAFDDGTYGVIGSCFGNQTRNQDVLYGHISANGKALHFKVFGGLGSDFPQQITYVGNNELFIAGEYSGTNIFNNGRALFNVRLKTDGTFIP